jgi:hypothetical protein
MRLRHYASEVGFLFPRLSPFRFQRAGSHPIGEVELVEDYGTTVVVELKPENADGGHACSQRGDTPFNMRIA